jgi:hypothetical protein
VDWLAIPAWTIETVYNTPDISTVIQELLGSYDYSSGGHIQLVWHDLFSDSNARRAGASWDNTTYDPPLLHIEYSAGAGYVHSQGYVL